MRNSGQPVNPKLPKGFITPWVLLVLKQWSIHGYLIVQRLNRMGFSEVDHPTLYKELRRLESQGYVASEWETGGSGPAKRVYSITEAGEELLKGWTEIVSGYQRMITGFFDLYAQVFGFPPAPGADAGPEASGPEVEDPKVNESETTGG